LQDFPKFFLRKNSRGFIIFPALIRQLSLLGGLIEGKIVHLDPFGLFKPDVTKILLGFSALIIPLCFIIEEKPASYLECSQE
jgi:hypothetical protein